MKQEELTNAQKSRKDFKVLSKYGIKYLDDCLLGILKNDLVLIGAESGKGKTELVNSIAIECGKNNRVHMFSLEAEVDEPVHRELYKILSRKYFNDFQKPRYQNINYRGFLAGEIDFSKYEDEATDNEMYEKFKNINVSYRKDRFAVSDLTRAIGEIKDECDVIIIDHVDYFDFDNESETNKNMTELMKEIRRINMVYGIAIIAISHLRKKGDYKQKIPMIEDFIGSGNKYKQVKTAILFGSNYDDTNYAEGLFGTYMYVAKTRLGANSNIVASLIFDSKTNSYKEDYRLNRTKQGGREIEEMLKSDYPYWAKPKENPVDFNEMHEEKLPF